MYQSGLDAMGKRHSQSGFNAKLRALEKLESSSRATNCSLHQQFGDSGTEEGQKN